MRVEKPHGLETQGGVNFMIFFFIVGLGNFWAAIDQLSPFSCRFKAEKAKSF